MKNAKKKKDLYVWKKEPIEAIAEESQTLNLLKSLSYLKYVQRQPYLKN